MNAEKKAVEKMGTTLAHMVERREAERTEILLGCERVRALAERLKTSAPTGDDVELVELFARAVREYLEPR